MGGKAANGCLTIIGLLVIVWVIGGIVGRNPTGSNVAPTALPGQSGVPASAAEASTRPPSSTPTVTPTPEPPTTPSPTQEAWQGVTLYVGNTGGDGVFVRRSPGTEDRIKAWPDRTVMEIIGPSKDVDGRLWKNVKSPDGAEGWVPAEYLTEATPTPTPTSKPGDNVPPGYALVLLSSRGTKEYGFAVVEGQVKNASGAPIRNVTAVVEWYTADGKFVKSSSALVEYNPLLANQTTPFHVTTSDNPEMRKYTVTFKELIGGTLRTWDARDR